MKPGDLVQHRNNPELIYVVLGEEVDPEDGLMNIVLLNLKESTRELWLSTGWSSEEKKHWKVISEKV